MLYQYACSAQYTFNMPNSSAGIDDTMNNPRRGMGNSKQRLLLEQHSECATMSSEQALLLNNFLGMHHIGV